MKLHQLHGLQGKGIFNAKAQRRKGAKETDESQNPSPPCDFATLRLCVKSPRSASGVALVITLIMLSVITFMAVTFLFVSHSERGAVATMTEQNTAGLAAETALERAKMTIIANMLTFTNPYTFSMLVSTSYVSGAGYNPGVKAATNVSYTYANGGALNQNDNLQNLANMVYDPPIPVCIVTNQLGSNENRLWLDANRNGVFDRTGLQPVTGPNGEHYDISGGSPVPVQGFPPNSIILSNFFIGDPQWIAVLEKSGFPPGLNQPSQWPLNYPHSATNRAVSRYAFQVVPVGDTLDVNYLFNQAKLRGPTFDGFLRNQGVGTWEDNLAAFLVDLNTNMWPMTNNPSGYARYEYFPDPTLQSRGAAFDDARAILRYRYNGSFRNLTNVQGLFGTPGVNAFRTDGVDGYTDGPLMTSNSLPVLDNDQPANPAIPWPGADNPTHYFTLSELFDKSKTGVPGVGFPERMAQAGTNLSSYDQSTFYRLQQQLGVDSAPDPKDKMNINWDNLVQSNAITGAKSATNFLAWRPLDFFTNAGIRLLVNAGYAVGIVPANQHIHTNLLVARFGVTNIQIMVYPTNLYTPSVHRLFQLAANLFDASTDRSFAVKNPAGYPTPSFPTVFRPIFQSVNGGSEIYVVGYDEVTNLTILNAATRDLTNPNERNQMKPNDMAYGVPLVVGAAKGIPNFNEFGMLTRVDVLRLLEFRRPDGGDPNVTKVNETNQMYIFGVSNVFGVEGWNSYTNPYPRDLQLIWAADMTAVMTNELSTTLLSNRVSTGSVITVSANTWPGWVNPSFALPSFRIPAYTNFPFLTNATYRQNPIGFVPQTHIFERTFQSPNFLSPRLMLSLNSRVRFILVDQVAQRIVDYVNLNNTSDTVDVFGKLAQSANCTTVGSATYLDPASHWCTNLLNGPAAPADSITYGIMNQISLGLNGGSGMVGSFSQDSSAGQDANKAVDGFRYNMIDTPNGPGSPIHSYPGVQPTFYRSNVFYVPFSPYTPILIQTSWQANDPLVHYTVGDLMDLSTAQSNFVQVLTKPVTTNYMVLPNIGAINGRYRPWGGNPVAGSSPSTAIGDYEMAAKDALVMRSDDWDFPTNKLPNIGWIGRVHRGTPWQTINLKSANIPFPTQTATNLADPQVGRWQRWTGNGFLVKNVGQFDLGLTNWFPLGSNAWDAIFTMGRTDPTLLDMFTTAFNDNASSGKMSVNQSGMAAWSAILSGVIVNSNINVDSWGVIQPAGYYDPFNTNTWSPLVHIVNAINDIRATNFGGGFRKLGEILTVPELTVASPFINRGDLSQPLASGLTLEQQNTLSDEVYERIPQQVLGLLKGPENPRFLILSYGQALKPADRSIVSSGPFFGMVTNYQITAEVATRALVRIEGSPDPSRNEVTEPDPSKRYPPRVIVEKFNQLPPD